jgi:hypothetical protein
MYVSTYAHEKYYNIEHYVYKHIHQTLLLDCNKGQLDQALYPTLYELIRIDMNYYELI